MGLVMTYPVNSSRSVYMVHIVPDLVSLLVNNGVMHAIEERKESNKC